MHGTLVRSFFSLLPALLATHILLSTSSVQAAKDHEPSCQNTFGRPKNIAVDNMVYRLNMPRYAVTNKARDNHRSHLYFELENSLNREFDIFDTQELAWRVLASRRSAMSLRSEKIDNLILFTYFDKITSHETYFQRASEPSLIDWIHLARISGLQDSHTFSERLDSFKKPTLPARLYLGINSTISAGIRFSANEKDFLVEMIREHFERRLLTAQMARSGITQLNLTPFWAAQGLTPLVRIKDLQTHPSFIRFVEVFTASLQDFASTAGLNNHIGLELQSIMGIAKPTDVFNLDNLD